MLICTTFFINRHLLVTNHQENDDNNQKTPAINCFYVKKGEVSRLMPRGFPSLRHASINSSFVQQT